MKRELREESGKGTGQARLAVRAVTQKRKDEDEGYPRNSIFLAEAKQMRDRWPNKKGARTMLNSLSLDNTGAKLGGWGCLC